jgi:hypothetical protein
VWRTGQVPVPTPLKTLRKLSRSVWRVNDLDRPNVPAVGPDISTHSPLLRSKRLHALRKPPQLSVQTTVAAGFVVAIHSAGFIAVQ